MLAGKASTMNNSTNLMASCQLQQRWWTILRKNRKVSTKSVSLSIVCIQLEPRKLPLYGVERWPRNRGFLSTILNGDAVGTKVSVRHRQGGRSSGVVVKRWLLRGGC